MGIDLKGRSRRTKTGRQEPKTTNPYVRLLVKLYKFLARRTASKFNETIVKRLITSRKNKAPLSLSKVVEHMKTYPGKTAVVIATVSDDARLFEVPKLSVCALKFTETARARILKAGGECITLDQFALRSPKGSNAVLLRGPTKARTAERYFGKAPGVPGSTTRPRVRSKGRKFEKARGRRKSRGFKV
jgi:large subunit ribosomal protein L18e